MLPGPSKPPPVIERTSGESYAGINLAGMLIAKAARGGRPLPENVWPQIEALRGVRVDRDSIREDGPYDVIFRAWLKDDQSRDREVWARVGTLAAAQANEGPDDARRRDTAISRTGLDTLAVYGSRREDVQRVGRISREI